MHKLTEDNQQQPNILLIMADDCTFNDLSVYGGENAYTPNIDRLAEEGVVFNRAYLTMSMCLPCRAELQSGLYPMRNGSAWNHSASRSSIKTAPHWLREYGYRVGIAGKIHLKPESVFPFEKVEGFDRNCVNNPTEPHNTAYIRDYMADTSDPFYLMVGLVEPHQPWVMGDKSQYPEEELKLPENIADTAKTRDAFARYLAEVTYMDGQVGDILRALDESGQADNTLVLFTSEQGSNFPGCKWTNWDTGVHTGLIAKWPGKIMPGKRTDALVQYTDFLPTFVELAGGDLSQHDFDGSSFLPVLEGKADNHRRYVYFMHNNLPEGPAYPIRSIADGEYHYIRNLTPEKLYIEKHVMGSWYNFENGYWISWIEEASENDETCRLVNRYMKRPAEELYKIDEDPYEMNNLANQTGYKEVQERLSKELDSWLVDQKDPGVDLDTDEALKAARKESHIYP